MTRPTITGLLISAMFVTTGGAVAGLGITSSGARYAEVLAVAPVQTAHDVPREVCEPATRTAGRPAAKRAPKCRTVYETKQSLVGYDVRYRLGGDVGTVRLDRPPGDRLRFENGEPRLADAG
jgi:uncharacterized protein YcfJ